MCVLTDILTVIMRSEYLPRTIARNIWEALIFKAIGVRIPALCPNIEHTFFGRGVYWFPFFHMIPEVLVVFGVCVEVMYSPPVAGIVRAQSRNPSSACP